jgi:hypothetical protein
MAVFTVKILGEMEQNALKAKSLDFGKMHSVADCLKV